MNEDDLKPQSKKSQKETPAKAVLSNALIIVVVWVIAIWTIGAWQFYQAENQHSSLFVCIYGAGVLILLSIIIYSFRHRKDPNWKISQTKPSLNPSQLMCVLLAFGLLPWFGSLFLFFSIFSAYKNDQHISGIVIRRFTSGHFRNTSVKLEVEFKTTSKLENEIVDPGTPEMLFFLLPGPGDKVDILYNPNKPKEIFVNQFWALYPVPLILAMLGTLFLWLAGKQYAGIHQNVP